VDKEKIENIFTKVQNHFENDYQINLLTYLIAKKDQTFYSKTNLAPDKNGNNLLKFYVNTYLDSLKNEITENGVFNWTSDYPENSILVKSFDTVENNFYVERHQYEKITNNDFLKNQYTLRYFNLEVPINETESIHFHQQISTNYKTSLKARIKIFENSDRLEVINLMDSFTVGTDFNFVSFFDKTDKSKCFTIITDLKPFEKLHGFLKQYKIAYAEVSKLSCMDLSNLKETEDCGRKCAALLKLEGIPTCIDVLNNELLSDAQTLSKKVLTEKGIKYEIRDGKTVLFPKNPVQLKVIIKILSDKIVKTHFRQKEGLSGHFEEIP